MTSDFKRVQHNSKHFKGFEICKAISQSSTDFKGVLGISYDFMVHQEIFIEIWNDYFELLKITEFRLKIRTKRGKIEFSSWSKIYKHKFSFKRGKLLSKMLSEICIQSCVMHHVLYVLYQYDVFFTKHINSIWIHELHSP